MSFLYLLSMLCQLHMSAIICSHAYCLQFANIEIVSSFSLHQAVHCLLFVLPLHGHNMYTLAVQLQYGLFTDAVTGALISLHH